MSHNEALFISFLVIALLIVLRVRRMVREQRFGLVTMWVIPALFACLTIAIMVTEDFTTPSDIGLAVLALVLGAAIGFYQGTHATIRVDHAARAMFVKMSPLGAGIFLAVLAVRVGIRLVYGTTTVGMPASVGAFNVISILLLVLAVGVIAGLRIYLARAYAQTPVRS
jgi:hypothetical protein